MLKHHYYKEQWREPGQLSLEQGRLRGTLSMAIKTCGEGA